MKIQRCFWNVVILGLLTTGAKCQSLEDGWSGIKPLKARKSTVEKQFGKVDPDKNRYYGYGVGDLFIQVNYSTKRCEPEQYNRGKYNVPEDTVLDYIVNFRHPPLLSDLEFRRAHYNRQTSSHRPDEFVLINERDGIMIHGYVDQNVEHVDTIYFKPMLQDKEKFRCG